jgi:hypothetical protein
MSTAFSSTVANGSNLCYTHTVNKSLDTLHRVQDPEGVTTLAWGCACEEPPNKKMAVVEDDEPWSDILYVFCHVACLKKEEA